MTTRVRPQNIIRIPARNALFLVATIREGHEADVRSVLGDFGGVVRGVAFREPEEELTCVVGIGAEAWDRLYDAPRPPGLHPFVALSGGVHTAPSTPGDLLFHLRSRRADMCFELGRRILQRFDGMVDVVDEVQGFRFFDERDLLGFVDGTENPNGVEAEDAVFVQDGVWAGSSSVVVQKYTHQMAAWDAQTVERQEAVIGRHKLSDVEFADDDKAPDAHLVLNTVENGDGVQQKIVRDNMPFGRLSENEFGTYFIGYSADVAVTEEMLRNMFTGKDGATHDAILDFSTAHTGCNFFVPTEGFIEDPDSVLNDWRAEVSAASSSPGASTDDGGV